MGKIFKCQIHNPSSSIYLFMILLCDLCYVVHADFFQDILTGTVIRTFDEIETPSPFGLNDKRFSRDKSLNCTCGLSRIGALNKDFTSRSTNISADEVPWLTLIAIQQDSSYSPKICSGTIINDFVIITAASCLIDIPEDDEERIRALLFPEEFLPTPEQITVVANDGHFNVTEIDLSNETSFTKLEVDDVTFNPYFISQNIYSNKSDWDIAFILLKRRLKFSDESGFVPICLPSAYYSAKGLEGVGMNSFGWLKTIISDEELNPKSVSYSLKMSEMLYVHPKYRCQAITTTNWISDRHFCSNGPKVVDSKFIESHGAPFMIQSVKSPYVFIQYGIVSWDFIGVLSGKKNVRVVTNLSGFLQVIEDFSDSVGARWCQNDRGAVEDPLVVPNWKGGADLNKMVHIPLLLTFEGKPVTPEHRQLHALKPCECGRQFINSTDVWYPSWKVMIHLKYDGINRTCSGSLINDKIILTTASCVHKEIKVPEAGKRKAKAHNHSQKLEMLQPNAMQVIINDRNEESLPIHLIFPHPKFDKLNLCAAGDYDVALLILRKPLNLIKLQEKVSPVCLPSLPKPGEPEESLSDQAIFPLPNGPWESIEFEMFSKKTCESIWQTKVFDKHNSSGAMKCEKTLNGKHCGGYHAISDISEEYEKRDTSFLLSTIEFMGKIRTKLIGIESNVVHKKLKPVIIKSDETEDVNDDPDPGDIVVLAYNDINRIRFNLKKSITSLILWQKLLQNRINC